MGFDLGDEQCCLGKIGTIADMLLNSEIPIEDIIKAGVGDNDTVTEFFASQKEDSKLKETINFYRNFAKTFMEKLNGHVYPSSEGEAKKEDEEDLEEEEKEFKENFKEEEAEEEFKEEEFEEEKTKKEEIKEEETDKEAEEEETKGKDTYNTVLLFSLFENLSEAEKTHVRTKLANQA